MIPVSPLSIFVKKLYFFIYWLCLHCFLYLIYSIPFVGICIHIRFFLSTHSFLFFFLMWKYIQMNANVPKDVFNKVEKPESCLVFVNTMIHIDFYLVQLFLFNSKLGEFCTWVKTKSNGDFHQTWLRMRPNSEYRVYLFKPTLFGYQKIESNKKQIFNNRQATWIANLRIHVLGKSKLLRWLIKSGVQNFGFIRWKFSNQ